MDQLAKSICLHFNYSWIISEPSETARVLPVNNFLLFFKRVAWVASEAIVLIEKLITSEALVLMYAV